MDGVPARTIVSSVGALDLGGASTQITFVPERGSAVPGGYHRALTLYGRHHHIYTHSYLCYGVVQVTNRVLAALIKVPF